MKAVIDEIDRRVLQHLIRDARMPFLEIARECGISGAAIHQRVKKLQDAGIILGSRLEVNPTILGFDVCAFVSIRVADPSLQAEMIDALKQVPEIVEAHFITGEYNILIKLYCFSNEHLMHTLFERVLPINGIIKTETTISLSEAFSRQIDVKYLDTEK